MFDFIRDHKRLMQLLLLVLIVPSFVLFGVEGYSRFNEKGEEVARVDGQSISQGEWDNAHKTQVERIRSQIPNLDSRLLDSPEARYGSLETLVRERVIAAAAAGSKFGASDQRVADELARNPVIATLRGPDGKLDMERYKQLVGAQGMTPQMFENSVRAELAGRQVFAGIEGSSLVSPAISNVALNAFFEKREVQLARFNAADFTSKVNVGDADIEVFYKANPQMFQAPEQASIEYVVLDLEAVKKGMSVNEQDLKTYYEQNAARLAGQEERRASHILVNAGKTASAADREKAKARAEELLAEVKKSPASFGEIAKKHSQDPGSAPQGGDLDFFARGAMTKPFEDAVFAMKKGDVSNVVETEFGYHIIQLTDVRAPAQKSFEQMRPQLEEELRKQQAQRKYAEAAEQFSNTVYEQSDTLKPVADKLKLEIRTAQNVGRQPAQGATGPLANPKFLAAVFTPDSIEKKRNTEAVEIGPNQMASARVVQYTPARTRPLAEVKDQVRERLVAQRAAELAKKEGQEKLAAWKTAPASATLPAAVVVSRDEAKVPAPVLEASLRADPASLPAWVGVDLGAEGFAVVKVNRVVARGAPPPQQAQQERASYTSAWGSAEAQAYYNVLKDRYKVQIKAPKPAPGTTSLTQ